MFDIHIRNLLDIQIDVFKAYFITNNREYNHKDGNFCFYAETVKDFFDTVNGMTEFYSNHSPKHCSFMGFECGVDEDGTYFISAIDYN
jgi:hypothetical protein